MKELNELATIFSQIDNPQVMEKLFLEIFTDAERNTFTLRLALLKDLYLGKTQREIANELGISLCKITRGSKILKNPDSVIKKILDRKYGGKNEKNLS